jgi:uracil-DNA glycosylase family 4
MEPITYPGTNPNLVECRRCFRLVEWRERVARVKVRRFKDQEYWGRPVPAFGELNAELVIVGLAPAAHGANRTGRMFTGDRSGDWLFDALHRFGFANQPVSTARDDGLALHNCLITAVIRCAPPQNKPLSEEMDNCRDYLFWELQLTGRKRIVMTLGQIAFREYLKARRAMGGQPLARKLKFCHGGEWVLPEGITLISSYHPSQQNTQTGKLTRAMFHGVFRRAHRILNGS